jgi:hypothetical protein
MPSTIRIDVPPRLTALVTLAALLEKLERGSGPVHAGQYRSVVDRLSAELAAVPQDATLNRLLEVFPATAELYENVQYAHAGLCRTPLEASMSSEVAAREVLRKVAR